MDDPIRIVRSVYDPIGYKKQTDDEASALEESIRLRFKHDLELGCAFTVGFGGGIVTMVILQHLI